jgi:hypothetical protein
MVGRILRRQATADRFGRLGEKHGEQGLDLVARLAGGHEDEGRRRNGAGAMTARTPTPPASAALAASTGFETAHSIDDLYAARKLEARRAFPRRRDREATQTVIGKSAPNPALAHSSLITMARLASRAVPRVDSTRRWRRAAGSRAYATRPDASAAGSPESGTRSRALPPLAQSRRAREGRA